VSIPAVVTEQLTKRFGALVAVNRLDLRVDAGQVFGFLGPNGAGKTTTIRLLLDFLRPDAGRATVLGGSGADPRIRAQLGYLPAELPVNPHWTPMDLLDFLAGLRGRRHPDWETTLLERFELDPGRPMGQLSTGNRRKAGIVQCVAHRPRLLILDEPTSGLDPLLQHQFQLLIRELVADGATVFLSSHVLPEVEQLADRVAIVRRGELVALNTVPELRRTARTRIDLRFADPVEPVLFAAIPEVVEVTAVGTTLRLVVEGPVDAVVKAAATRTVLGVATHEADLEDVFLSFYAEPEAPEAGRA
jgi:ABC-2 type transport system ATP-binding protein